MTLLITASFGLGEHIQSIKMALFNAGLKQMPPATLTELKCGRLILFLHGSILGLIMKIKYLNWETIYIAQIIMYFLTVKLENQ